MPIPIAPPTASGAEAPKKASRYPVINIDADPENADWIRIVRAERIASKVPGGPEIWNSAVEKAGGSRSGALRVFYNLLREAGIPEPD